MRPTGDTPRSRCSGDVLGLAFFLSASLAVLCETTGLDPLGFDPDGPVAQAARVLVPAWGG